MINNLAAFHAAIAAVAPIDGVSADGTISLAESATAEQIVAAHDAAAAYVEAPDTPPPVQHPPLQELPRPKHITEL
jgi:hypothetical protein